MESFLESHRRVTRKTPCPICGRPDWCTIAANGEYCICKRVQSSRAWGDAGWLHRVQVSKEYVPKEQHHADALSPAELNEMAKRFRADVSPAKLDRLARSLGLPVKPLKQLRIGYSHANMAWTFPMLNSSGNILGFRLRTMSGEKLAVRGGHEGLFFPDGQSGKRLQRLFMPEGPTSLAAVLALGLFGIGRPSARSGVQIALQTVQSIDPVEVIVLGDNDKADPVTGEQPGHAGAEHLAEAVRRIHPRVKILYPPPNIKDVRDWFRFGVRQHHILEMARRRRPQ